MTANQVAGCETTGSQTGPLTVYPVEMEAWELRAVSSGPVN